MRVVKRNGTSEAVSFDKVTRRIQLLCQGVTKQGDHFGPEITNVDPVLLSQKVITAIKDGIHTEQLDDHAATVAASMVLESPDYATLAARIVISNMHKKTLRNFSDIMQLFYERKVNGTSSPMLDQKIYKIIEKNARLLDQTIDYNRDYNIDYFGFKTLEKSYLWHFSTDQHQFWERPQHMYMRVAVGIFQEDIPRVIETYHALSLGKLSCATPMLFNAGMESPQLSSCYLLTCPDSIEGIYDTLKESALISKLAGGIGISFSQVRGRGSVIRGTHGVSNGILSFLRVFNESSLAVDQGGGKRKGSIAIYLEPHHPDIFEFLEAKIPHGNMDERCLALFYSLWVSHLFMERIQLAVDRSNDRTQNYTDNPVLWSLFCPDECPGLTEAYGEEYRQLYQKYEQQGKFRRQVDILKIWTAILKVQKEAGAMYMCYKCHANEKSNQKHYGTINCSNLCAEIVEYSDANETAVCNLNSIPLSVYVDAEKQTFDHQALSETVALSTRLLNRVIDINYYPTEKARYSNLKHRPIGIGVQGLADAFQLLRMPFESPEAKQLNREIFETIYYSALKASNQMAQEQGPYESYPGSPASQGLLQPDLWAQYSHSKRPEAPSVNPDTARVPGGTTSVYSDRWDWTTLREAIKRHGLRNSLTTACMPTASTAQILGNTEAIEPATYNLYVRGVLSGEFIVCNKYLQKDLVARNLWTPEVTRQLVKYQGSVQQIPQIPQDLKDLYKTAFEIKQKTLIDLAADRAVFIDQSQSFNWFVKVPTDSILTSMHLYAWKKGLKTGMYYLRREAITQGAQFTVAPEKVTRQITNSENITPVTPNAPEVVNQRTNPSASALPSASPSTLPSSLEITQNVLTTPLSTPMVDPEVKLCRLNDPDCAACAS